MVFPHFTDFSVCCIVIQANLFFLLGLKGKEGRKGEIFTSVHLIWLNIISSMTNWKRCCYCRIILYVLAATVGELQTHGPCNITQYIELRKPGIVQCSFDAGMYGIYWYDSEDVTTQRPFFFYEKSKKSGQGYTSGEFDVEPNGSLVIRNVTFKHDHVFTVACLAHEDSQAVSVRVTVVVIVKPTQLHPFVSQCYGENNCYRSYWKVPNLNCFVTGSRPAVKLRWFKRTIHSDQKLPSEKFIHNHSNSVFSTYANLTTVLLSANHFAVAVCKASSVPPMLPITESIVLLERELEYSFSKTEQKYIEEGAKMTLDCLAGNDFIVVWKKRAKANFGTVVGLVSEKRVFRTSEYDVNSDKSLVLNKTSIHNEGMYVCFHSDGISTTGTLYNITVYIYPVPNYPVVEGCGSHTPCVIIYEGRQGELTCKLLGIRPVVSLKWRIADENLLEKLTFFGEMVTVSPNAETYDVVVTTQFSLRDKSISKITVECFSFGKFADVINIPTKQVDLTFSGGEISEIKADLIALPMSWLILIVTAISMLLTLGYGGLLLKVLTSHQQKGVQGIGN
ncbi:hypothetical protein HOLleu_41535 [Holothuria leucospilota]|uniref:Ig-like domain-containing protein n=1 Tax=Holothuria leucospilota TaxID=206669 RepID=A0A9Q0YE27_HOLLE|nr:hypothetical protein HOLleu_41535 [Holothuria leucospilota]